MKNCDEALSYDCERAMEIAPRVCDRGFSTPLAENSPWMVLSEPPRPVPCGSPPCIMKPAMIRWKVRPS